MKKYTFAILLTVFTVILTGCGTKPELPAAPDSEPTSAASANTLSEIKEDGVLTIGLDDTLPPFEYRNDKNELEGFDIDFAEALGKELGVDIEYRPSKWDGIIPALEAGRFDIVLSAMNITEERSKKVDFVEYLGSGQIVVVEAGNPLDIQSIEDLRGKVVGVQLGSTGETAAESIEGIKELTKYDGTTDVLNDMGLGRVDAAVVGESIAKYYITKKPEDFEIVGEPFQLQPMGIAMRKGDRELQEALAEAVQTLKDNGTFNNIYKKWFGTDVPD